MNFKAMTLLLLLAYAKEKGIRGVSTLKKNQLIERIIASENKSIQTKAEESIKSEKNTTDSEEVQILIDGLIIRMLRPYYLFNHDTPKVNKLLQSIDFSKHNFIHYLFYKLPKPIIKILYLLIKK